MSFTGSDSSDNKNLSVLRCRSESSWNDFSNGMVRTRRKFYPNRSHENWYHISVSIGHPMSSKMPIQILYINNLIVFINYEGTDSARVNNKLNFAHVSCVSLKDIFNKKMRHYIKL